MGRSDQLRPNRCGNEPQHRISRFAALFQRYAGLVVAHAGVIECAGTFEKRFEAESAGGINKIMSLAA